MVRESNNQAKNNRERAEVEQWNKLFDLLKGYGVDVEAAKKEAPSPEQQSFQAQQQQQIADPGYGQAQPGFAARQAAEAIEHPFLGKGTEFSSEYPAESSNPLNSTQLEVLIQAVNNFIDHNEDNPAKVEALLNSLQAQLQNQPQLSMKLQQQMEYARKQRLERQHSPELNLSRTY